MKKLYRIGKKILNVTILFWILETVLFLILYGWHWKATEDPEIICDTLVTLGFFIGWSFVILALLECLEFNIHLLDKFKEEEKEDKDHD